jgi:hypothetical protein
MLRPSSLLAAPLSAFGFALIGVVVACSSGCVKAFDCGGLSTDAPNVESGKGSATRSDNGAVSGNATWASGSFAAVDITLGGAFDLPISKDVTGTDLDSLVSDGAFPICIGFADNSGTTREAQLQNSPTFLTDATHTGNAALLKLEGNNLVGRFVVHLVSSQDASKTLDVTDGAFNATRR